LALVLLAGTAPVAGQTGEVRPDTQRQILQKLQTAHVLYSQRDYAAARTLYLEVLPHYPQDFVILKNLAFSNYRLRRYEEAAQYFRQAYELNPTREVLDYLARSLSNAKRYDEAARLFRQLAESPGAPAVAWQLAAEAYAGAGQMDESEAAYDAYLQRNPGDLAARTDLGELYVEKKDYPKAVEQFRLVLSTNPNYAAALKGMGLAAARQDNHTEALEYYDRVLRLDRRDGEARACLFRCSGATPATRKWHERCGELSGGSTSRRWRKLSAREMWRRSSVSTAHVLIRIPTMLRH
jgi:tetratricopeptide (TPR) repeat protein